MQGIKGTKLHSYMEQRLNARVEGEFDNDGRVESLQLRVMKVYMAFAWHQGYFDREGQLHWLGTEATIDNLASEFNEHELIELLLPCVE